MSNVDSIINWINVDFITLMFGINVLKMRKHEIIWPNVIKIMCWIHNYFYEIEFQTIKYHIREKFGTIREIIRYYVKWRFWNHTRISSIMNLTPKQMCWYDNSNRKQCNLHVADFRTIYNFNAKISCFRFQFYQKFYISSNVMLLITFAM